MTSNPVPEVDPRVARDLAIAQVEANADVAWRNEAAQSVEYMATQVDAYGDPVVFTVDDLHPLVGDPPGEKRAWGAVMRNARKDGVVVACGYVESKRAAGHCHPIMSWRGVQ